MAKVQGPLFSMEASGKFGGALVFGRWKGRPTVRQLVTPANPNSQGQEDARNRMRVTGAIQSWVNTTTMVLDGETLTDKARIQGVTPGEYAWNGYLVDTIIGQGFLTYTAAVDAWDALEAGEKTDWNTAAAALSPSLGQVFQTEAGGGATTPMPAGGVFFIYQWGLAQLGLASTPGATPPVYA